MQKAAEKSFQGIGFRFAAHLTQYGDKGLAYFTQCASLGTYLPLCVYELGGGGGGASPSCEAT